MKPGRIPRVATLAALTLSGAVLPGSVPAVADVLMLDFNLSRTEVEAARRAARDRGEKLVIYPELTAAQEKQAEPLRRQFFANKRKMHALMAGIMSERGDSRGNSGAETSWDELPARGRDLSARYSALEQENARLEDRLSALAKEAGRIDAGSIKKLVNGLADRGIRLSSLVISSHHSSDFHGHAGAVDFEPLLDTLKSRPELTSGLRSTYLWGCYTSTDDKLIQWKQALPQLKFVAGFEGQGPSSDRPESGTILHRFLTREKAVLKGDAGSPAVDPALIRDFFMETQGIGRTEATLCVGDTVVSKQGTHALYGPCDPQKVIRARGAMDLVRLYAEAREPLYEDVPRSTGISALRTAYTELRQLSHCKNIPGITGDAERAIRLIFFRNVRANFNAAFRGEINEANRILSENGASEVLFPQLLMPNLTRGRMLDELDSFEMAAATVLARHPELKPADRLLLERVIRNSRAVLRDIRCIRPYAIDTGVEAPFDEACLAAPQ